MLTYKKILILFFLVLSCQCSSLKSFAPQKHNNWTKPLEPKYEINFGKETPDYRIIYTNELFQWGETRNLILQKDLALRSLQDFEAVIVEPYGLRFRLDAPEFSRLYLYLDLVSYRAKENSQPRKNSYLEVLVNGYSLRTFYNPIPNLAIVTVDLEHIQHGWLDILLRGTRLENANFAIWDAFVSSSLIL